MKKTMMFAAVIGALVLSGCASTGGGVGEPEALAQTAETGEFNEPWSDGKKAIIIDAYHANGIDWDELAKDKNVVAIIHKESEGSKIDQKYAERKAQALQRGYLWGSYHLGRPGDPIKQAERYLEVVKPADDELIALDLEALSWKFMSLKNARKFIQHIAQQTGRYPVLYTNHSTARTIADKAGNDEVFSKARLWYARFRKDIPNFPTGTWDTYALWQFSSEINCKAQGECLYNVPGTRFDMDVNVYYGTPEELRANWPLTQMVTE